MSPNTPSKTSLAERVLTKTLQTAEKVGCNTKTLGRIIMFTFLSIHGALGAGCKFNFDADDHRYANEMETQDSAENNPENDVQNSAFGDVQIVTTTEDATTIGDAMTGDAIEDILASLEDEGDQSSTEDGIAEQDDGEEADEGPTDDKGSTNDEDSMSTEDSAEISQPEDIGVTEILEEIAEDDGTILEDSTTIVEDTNLSETFEETSEDTAQSCVPATESCDGLDNDCDGEIDEDFPEIGASCTEDCGIKPTFQCNEDGTATTCQSEINSDGSKKIATFEDCGTIGVDDDCDGFIDFEKKCEYDDDGDGVGSETEAMAGCNPNDAAETPGSPEICDGKNNNCDQDPLPDKTQGKAGGPTESYACTSEDESEKGCEDEIDNDGDQLKDKADPDCQTQP